MTLLTLLVAGKLEENLCGYTPRQTTRMAKELNTDEVYAYALYKTLTNVDSPLTVGLYSSCHNRIKMILTSIEGHMGDEAKKKEQKSTRSRATIRNLISLIFRLLFYRPVWTRNKDTKKCNRYVFVRFSAWHFAGSDMLWAGLVMQLCRAFQDSFGKLHLSLFRVVQYDEEKDRKEKKIEDSSEIWRAKKVCCCPLWAVVLMILMVCLFILVPIIIFSFPKFKLQDDDQKYDVIEGFFISLLGVPALGVLKFIFLLIKHVIFSQDVNVRNALDNKKLSGQLGLMHEVRKEMRLMSCFIYFMEIFERKNIKVVLEITNLDRCTPAKIVGILDAINILLSDEESPFISLVAIDPGVLTQKIDQAKECFSKKDRAYGFLDRIITLPFTVPPLCEVSKCKVFRIISSDQSERLQRDENLCGIKTSVSSEHVSLIDTSLQDEDQATSLTASKTISCLLNENRVERLIQEAFQSIYLCDQSKLHNYISENAVSMRRVTNSIRVSMMVVNALVNVEVPPPERVAAWVVLVDRWPCRLSWILQCIEDEQQTWQTSDTVECDHNMTLWDVFSEHRIELHVIREEVENFLERDDDPELFEMFLRKDYTFTVKEADQLKDYTVNLDYSIKNELARIRQISTLRAIGKHTLKRLSPNTVFNMSVEDVCNELSRLKIPEKYAEIVKQNNINGKTLLLSDPADLRQVMQMTLGEWTAFRIHFLGVMSSNYLSKANSEPVISIPNAICPPTMCHNHS